MCLRAWSQAHNVHLVFLPRPNIPGSGLDISSLIGPFSGALVFLWPAFSRLLSLVSDFDTTQCSLQSAAGSKVNRWRKRGGLRGGDATLHWGLNWGRGHSQGSFKYFPLGYTLLMWTLREMLRLLTLSPALWWGVIAALAFSPQVLQSAMLGSVISNVKHIR